MKKSDSSKSAKSSTPVESSGSLQRNSSKQAMEQQQQRQQARPTAADNLRQAMNISSQTEEMGEATLSELQIQRETIQRTQMKADEVEAHVDRSNFLLKGMKSIFGNAFRKGPPKPKEVVEAKAAERDAANAVASSEIHSQMGTFDDGGRRGQQQSSRAGAASAKGATSSKPRDEEDELLDALSKSVGRIKVVAQEMHGEVQLQDKMLDQLSDSISRNKEKIEKNTATAKKLAR
jgi:Snare region anchored in the vesicle membrane C-terminus